MSPLNIIFVAAKYLKHQRLLVSSIIAFDSWQMQRGGKGKAKKREARRQRDTDAASGEATPENEIEEDDLQEADADAFDTGFDAELREAELREASFSAAHVARLEAEIERLGARLNTARFEMRDQSVHGGNTKSRWKADSLRLMSADTPLMTKSGSIFGLRNAVFAWLGSYSFVLRLAPTERTMMTPAEHALQRDIRIAFLVVWTQASLTQLQQDVYMGLQRHLGNSILVSPIFTNVTTETEECATKLWDALLQAFHPRSLGVVLLQLKREK